MHFLLAARFITFGQVICCSRAAGRSLPSGDDGAIQDPRFCLARSLVFLALSLSLSLPLDLPACSPAVRSTGRPTQTAKLVINMEKPFVRVQVNRRRRLIEAAANKPCAAGRQSKANCNKPAKNIQIHFGRTLWTKFMFVCSRRRSLLVALLISGLVLGPAGQVQLDPGELRVGTLQSRRRPAASCALPLVATTCSRIRINGFGVFISAQIKHTNRRKCK